MQRTLLAFIARGTWFLTNLEYRIINWNYDAIVAFEMKYQKCNLLHYATYIWMKK